MKRVVSVLVLLAAVASFAQAEWTVESDHFTGGWNAVWNSPMMWDVSDDSAVSGGVKAWWLPATLEGGVQGIETMKWYTRPITPFVEFDSTNRYEWAPDPNPTKWGVKFVEQSWSGEAAGVAKIASYISPGYLFGQNDWGYQYYQPDVYSWENKPYFKSQARLAVANADADTVLRVRTYAFDSSLGSTGWAVEGAMTLISYTDLEVGALGDYTWADFLFAVAKPNEYMSGDGVAVNDRVWFEVEVLNGNANTLVYIDELRFISEQDGGTEYGDPDWILAIPEPMTMSLLALGGLLIRRK
jgi:hypothetical protein